ncbi:hypothetical protein [Acidihalobacter prosperus]|uniref:Phosphoglycerate mutase n=1 Tax=Acidihalobacter prosperus TaxID=160660 RepID=A0A1A6C841_9GAMM|nr:hypothetical protein [Acidihalobacter prosperus]OBS10714.1 hypothetical protein Thpro_020430 [Acidihalobacter prosperus]
MHLHLIVPGLARPLRRWQQDYAWQPHADHLEVLLAGARHRGRGAHNHIAMAAEVLGWQGDNLPIAAFRAQGRLPPAKAGCDWVCADPVHLSADANSAVVWDSRRFDLRLDEAQELAAALNRALGDGDWHFRVETAGEWYLSVPADDVPNAAMLHEVAGRDLRHVAAPNAGSSKWRTRLTEIQMILHGHPVNLAREARGEPAVNSLWCWGGGHPATWEPDALARVIGGGSVLAGMAAAAGLTHTKSELDEFAPPLRGGAILLVLDDLAEAAAYDDIQAWERTLGRLNSTWFARLVRALDTGEVADIELHADGNRWHIRRRSRLARWRRPRALAAQLADS